MPTATATPAENFPVASLLIRRDLRPLVRRFYAFARAADDIADDHETAPQARLAALDACAAGLDGAAAGLPEALALRRALHDAARAGALEHAHRLLDAFRRDAAGQAVRGWGDLADYCALSAEPVGRFLLDIHDERGADARDASDALCTLLQVLNHLQDLRTDFLLLGRVYLPADWMAEAGAGTCDLAAPVLSAALRRVVDRTLERCDTLHAAASALPGALASRRLAGESRTILHLARRLSARLRHADPMARRVRNGRADIAVAAALGAARIVAGSGRGLDPARAP